MLLDNRRYSDIFGYTFLQQLKPNEASGKYVNPP